MVEMLVIKKSDFELSVPFLSFFLFPAQLMLTGRKVTVHMPNVELSLPCVKTRNPDASAYNIRLNQSKTIALHIVTYQLMLSEMF